MVRHLWQLFNYQFNSMKTAPHIKQLPHLYQDCLQDLLAMNIYLCNKAREITDNVLAVAFEIPLFNSYTSCLINWPNPLKFRKTTEKKKKRITRGWITSSKSISCWEAAFLADLRGKQCKQRQETTQLILLASPLVFCLCTSPCKQQKTVTVKQDLNPCANQDAHVAQPDGPWST